MRTERPEAERRPETGPSYFVYTTYVRTFLAITSSRKEEYISHAVLLHYNDEMNVGPAALLSTVCFFGLPSFVILV